MDPFFNEMGMSLEISKVGNIKHWSQPVNQRIETVLGLANYYY